MFDFTSLIGMPFDEAKTLLLKEGYLVEKIKNTSDDRQIFDSELVVQVRNQKNIVYLVTSEFLINI